MFADKAAASCGDYLHTSETGDATPSPADDSSPVCSGPHCSAGSLGLSPSPTITKRHAVEIVDTSSTRHDDLEVDVMAARFPVQSRFYLGTNPDVALRPPIETVL